MKHLGIDFGLKRVGLAVSDPDETMAFPLGVLTRTTREKLFADLREILEREGVERIVIGMPRAPDGGDCLTARQVENFAASLAKATDAPIVFADETLTSAVAEIELRQAGLKGKKLKKALDAQAAVHILNGFLAGSD